MVVGMPVWYCIDWFKKGSRRCKIRRFRGIERYCPWVKGLFLPIDVGNWNLAFGLVEVA